MENRYKLKNILNHKDKFRDNENKEDLDSLDVVRILNHYDKVLTEFIKKHTEQQNKIAHLETKLAESEKLIEFYINSGKEQCDEINKINHRSIIKSDEIDQLKQQLAETDKLMQEYLSKCLSLEQQLAEKDLKIIELETKLNLKDKETNV